MDTELLIPPGPGLGGLVDVARLTDAGHGSDPIGRAHRLYEHLIGLWAPGVIEAAFDLGIFAALAEGPETAARLAERLNTGPRATRVLLDALSAYDMVDRRGGQEPVWYALPADLHECFRNDGLYSLAGKIRYDRMMAWDAWRGLADAVRTDGGGGEHGNGISDHEYESLVGGINFWAPPLVAILARALRERGWSAGSGARLLDVGCGTGIYSQLLLREFPELSSVGLDVPRIVPLAESQGDRLAVGDRFRPVAGDFRTEDWGTGFDLVLFANIFHLQTADSAVELSRRASKALADDGVVAIVDQIIDEHAGPQASQDRFFRLFAASMLATGGGDAYPLDAYDQWLGEAGMRRVALVDGPMHRILLAVHA